MWRCSFLYSVTIFRLWRVNSSTALPQTLLHTSKTIISILFWYKNLNQISTCIDRQTDRQTDKQTVLQHSSNTVYIHTRCWTLKIVINPKCSYVLKHGSPDISCVVITTCNKRWLIQQLYFEVTLTRVRYLRIGFLRHCSAYSQWHFRAVGMTDRDMPEHCHEDYITVV